MGCGEFFRFIGLWLLMSTVGGGFDKMEHWSKTIPSPESGAPFRFNEWMSKNRFKSIQAALKHADEECPACVDKFFSVRQLTKLWNENMMNVFRPSWLNCLDESMSMWHSKITCPGWVFCPRKPHPFGNECHRICCVESGIMFGIELVEGKDHPMQLRRGIGDEHSPTVGLLMRLTKLLHGTGKVVMLDSGFCVLNGIIELKKLGVHASALMKKEGTG